MIATKLLHATGSVHGWGNLVIKWAVVAMLDVSADMAMLETQIPENAYR